MKRIISAMLSLMLAGAAFFVFATVASAELTGNGTEGDPYIVSNDDDWTEWNRKKSGYVVLNGDVLNSAEVIVSQDTVIDMQGHTISGANKIIGINGEATLTIKSTSSEKGIVSSAGNMAVNPAKGKMIIDNVKINSDTSPAININNENADVEIINAEVHGKTIGITAAKSKKITIKKSEIIGETSYAVRLTASSEGAVIEESRLSNTGVINTILLQGAANLDIIDSNILGTISDTGKALIYMDKNYTGAVTVTNSEMKNNAETRDNIFVSKSTQPAEFIVNSGSFKGGINNSSNTTSVKVNGGTFTFNPSAYVDTEVYDVSDNGNGTFTVAAKSVESDNKMQAEELPEVTGDNGEILQAPDNTALYSFTKNADEISGKSIAITMTSGAGTKTKMCSIPELTNVEAQAKLGILIFNAPDGLECTYELQ